MQKMAWGYELDEINIEQLIKDKTFKLATNLTDNQQFVVLKVENKTKVYEIIFGMPADSKRHGIGNRGHLIEGGKKIALLKAYNTRNIRVIQDAKNNPETEYMREHAINKGINSILIGPLIFQLANFSYLIVIDKTIGQGWSKNKISYFKKEIKELKNEIIKKFPFRPNRINGSDKQSNILFHIKDRLGNATTITGGLAEKMKKIIPQEQKNLHHYIEIIIEETKRIEKEMASWYDLHAALISNKNEIRNEPLKEYLKIFKEDNILLESNGTGAIMLELPNAILYIIFKTLKKYMLANSSDGIEIKCHDYDGEISINLHASGFAEYKYGEFELSIVQSLVEEKLQGKFILSENLCQIILPQSLL